MVKRVPSRFPRSPTAGTGGAGETKRVTRTGSRGGRRRELNGSGSQEVKVHKISIGSEKLSLNFGQQLKQCKQVDIHVHVDTMSNSILQSNTQSTISSVQYWIDHIYMYIMICTHHIVLYSPEGFLKCFGGETRGRKGRMDYVRQREEEEEEDW